MKTFAYITPCLIALTTNLASADSSVGQDCADVSLWNPGHWVWFLRANCYDKNKDSFCSLMWLDTCFAEVNGVLQPKLGGAGLRHCEQCTINDYAMFCQCRDDNGNMVPTTTNLNDTLSVDDDGYVTCFNETADSCGAEHRLT
ncbi:hypothetical protein PG993_008529 [Apiospora rasikravindrae]|uniref:Cyanovirin-N domain-containing protein n=1 Tax=Apiospora rasikravindrae TaxID=990691 RepID=A0ABR1T0M0_9PEZI